MTENIELQLVIPDRLLLSEKVQMVTIPGGEGDYGVMVGHQPIITTIRPGILEVEYADGISKKYFVSGGFAEVTNERCIVLTDEAINIDDFKKNDIANKIEKIKITIESSNERELYENQQYLIVLEDLLGSA